MAAARTNDGKPQMIGLAAPHHHIGLGRLKTTAEGTQSCRHRLRLVAIGGATRLPNGATFGGDELD
jgi:hypothetical protein